MIAREVHTSQNPPSSPRLLLAVLASIQFVHVLDFVVVMPLGAFLMKSLAIGPKSLAAFTSAYNFAAAASGLAGAWWLDRFNRKATLLVTLIGFFVGTLACAFAIGPGTLTAARFITGCFGGIIQALLFAVIGDSFREEHRGFATGTVVSAFSLASVLGIPVSLWFAERFDWRSPFIALSILTLFITFATWRLFPKFPAQAQNESNIDPGLQTEGRSTWNLIFDQNSMVGFLLITLLMFSGFTVIPFMSAYLVTNVGLRESDLTLVFLVGGLATLFTSQLAGTLSDRFGKPTVFAWLAGLSILPILLLTNLGHASLPYAIVVTTLFTVLVSGRSVPALAMITSSVDSASRGRYLSLTSCVQQIASGLASLMAGLFLTLKPDGTMANYESAGVFSAVCAALAIVVSRKLKPDNRIFTQVPKNGPPPPLAQN